MKKNVLNHCYSPLYEKMIIIQSENVMKLFMVISNLFLKQVDDKAQVSFSWATVAHSNDGPFSMIFVHLFEKYGF